MFKTNILLGYLFSLIFFTACQDSNNTSSAEEVTKQSWEQIEKKAKGTTVTWMKYMGDKKANKHMDDYVVPQILKRYGIKLKIIPGQGNSIVSSIMTEKEAGLQEGQTDLVWINGATFYQLRQIDGLFGPFAQSLPNSKYIDFTDPVIRYDFQEDTKGYELPWGKASFILVTDANLVKNPPVSMQDFENYWKANPGKFTLSLDFFGYSLLKSWLIELAGGVKELDGKYNPEKYDKYSNELWAFINRNKKYFWKKGETFPENNTTISQMFGIGEVNFAFAYGINTVDKTVNEGLFPKTSKVFVLKAGSIYASHYLGIPFNAKNKEGALVVANFLISPEAQIEKSDANKYGSSPVFEFERLEENWQQKYMALPKVKYGMAEEEVQESAINELQSQYMINVTEDFRKKVIEKE